MKLSKRASISLLDLAGREIERLTNQHTAMREIIDREMDKAEKAILDRDEARLDAQQAQALVTIYKGELELIAEAVGADSPAEIRSQIEAMRAAVEKMSQREAIANERAALGMWSCDQCGARFPNLGQHRGVATRCSSCAAADAQRTRAERAEAAIARVVDEWTSYRKHATPTFIEPYFRLAEVLDGLRSVVAAQFEKPTEKEEYR